MKKLLVIAAAAALCAGCVETAGTRVTLDTDSGEAHVLQASPRLKNRVKVTNVSYSDINGIKKANVTIESITHRRQELQARMIWLDADGAEIDPDGKPFRAIVLDGMDTFAISGLSPNTRGVTAKLQVRETSTAQK